MALTHSSWGRLKQPITALYQPKSAAEATIIIPRTAPGLAIGLSRSYGDSALNTNGTIWQTSALDAFLEFDTETGLLTCEAGVTLGAIQRTFAPLGWMLVVTPGTQHVTVAGAIANDVHGKNHHVAGTFGCHVQAIDVLRTTGELLTCSADNESGLYVATIGGLGLTGVILRATLQLEPVANPYFASESIVFESLEEYFSLTKSSTEPYTVSWIDTSTDGGRRGIFHHGRRATEPEGDLFEQTHPKTAQRVHGNTPAASGVGKLTVPFTPPVSLVNRLTLPALNSGYFQTQARTSGHAVTDYGSFFYPLDAVSKWNRMYGPKGFYQFQAALPWKDAAPALTEMLAIVSRSGEGSFLGVLKELGDVASPGLLSYPQAGINFTVDFPDKGESTSKLIATLERIAVQAGGRMYPAKDARMKRESFAAGYPNLTTFQQYRDPGIVSDFARRLLDE